MPTESQRLIRDAFLFLRDQYPTKVRIGTHVFDGLREEEDEARTLTAGGYESDDEGVVVVDNEDLKQAGANRPEEGDTIYVSDKTVQVTKLRFHDETLLVTIQYSAPY